ncbi:MAG: hypothetical protein LBU64_10235 [Planctomycetota bacterium]|jgi:hypothetical protein|nr:hypothetical protein [Planctomycetota bacterium]
MTANPPRAAADVPPEGFPARPARPGRFRRNLPFVLAALLFLGSGAGIGAGVAALHFRKALAEPEGSDARFRDLIVSGVAGSVRLSPAEALELERIVAAGVEETTRIRGEYGKKVRGRLNAMCIRICRLLGPERTAQCGEWLQRAEMGAGGVLDGS